MDERCGGVLGNIDEVIPNAERDKFIALWKQATDFAVEELDTASPTIAGGEDQFRVCIALVAY